MLAWTYLSAGENELMELADEYYADGDYFTAISEAMRYQWFYPTGRLYPRSLVLIGKSYYRGNNYQAALNVLFSCYHDFPRSVESEEALYLVGFIKLMKGSPPDAIKTLDIYRMTYRSGIFIEEVYRDACYESALDSVIPDSIKEIKKYR